MDKVFIKIGLNSEGLPVFTDGELEIVSESNILIENKDKTKLSSKGKCLLSNINFYCIFEKTGTKNGYALPLSTIKRVEDCATYFRPSKRMKIVQIINNEEIFIRFERGKSTIISNIQQILDRKSWLYLVKPSQRKAGKGIEEIIAETSITVEHNLLPNIDEKGEDDADEVDLNILSKRKEVDRIYLIVHEIKIACTFDEIQSIAHPYLCLNLNGKESEKFPVDISSLRYVNNGVDINPTALELHCPVFEDTDLSQSKLQIHLKEDLGPSGTATTVDASSAAESAHVKSRSKSYGTMTLRENNLLEVIRPHPAPTTAVRSSSPNKYPNQAFEVINSSRPVSALKRDQPELAVDDQGARSSLSTISVSESSPVMPYTGFREEIQGDVDPSSQSLRRMHSSDLLLLATAVESGKSSAKGGSRPPLRRLPSRERSISSTRIRVEKGLSSKSLRVHQSVQDALLHAEHRIHWYNFYQLVVDVHGNLVRDVQPSAQARLSFHLASSVGTHLPKTSSRPNTREAPPQYSEGSDSASPIVNAFPSPDDSYAFSTGLDSSAIPPLTSSRAASAKKLDFRSRIHTGSEQGLLGIMQSYVPPARPPSASQEVVQTARQLLTSRGAPLPNILSSRELSSDRSPVDLGRNVSSEVLESARLYLKSRGLSSRAMSMRTLSARSITARGYSGRLDYAKEETGDMGETFISKEDLEMIPVQEKHDWEIEFEGLQQPQIPTVNYIEGDGYYFTKHLDENTGLYYYYNHVNQMSTWDKPSTDIAVYVSPESQEINETIRWNQFCERKVAQHYRSENIKEFRRKDLIERIREERDQKKRQERDLKHMWDDAFMIAIKNRDPRGCECSMSYKPYGIHSSLFSFEQDYHTKLRILRLEGMGLEVFPSEIGTTLINLEVLSISSNRISTLPDTIINLSSLTELNAINNILCKLPEKIGLMAALSRFDLSNNRLVSLPDSFAGLRKLERIHLEKNNIMVLPENLDFMASCKSINLNSNKLIRLPKCLSRMPRLQSISASYNDLTYITREICFCRMLKALRLSRNRIGALPDVVGDLKTLEELVLDYNEVHSLPASFYLLTSLKTLRLEGNPPLQVPGSEVIAGGAGAVVKWCHERWLGDEQWRMRFIISEFQKYLTLILEVIELIDQSKFEPHVQMFGDTWFALQLTYLWNDLMPALKQLDRDRYRFQFQPNEVIWAFQSFEDANGPLLRYEQAEFKRCSCNDEDGRRNPCVPPRKGYMCRRQCALIKDRIVMKADKQFRLWQAYKKNGIEEAVKLAELEANKYLASKEGSQWVQELSFQQAEEAMTDRGVDRVVKKRQRRAEDRKKGVIAKYDRKKRKIAKARDIRAASLRKQISALTARARASKGGFVKETLDKQIDDLSYQLANMPENDQLLKLTEECAAKCKEVDDELLEADDFESDLSDSSDSDENYEEILAEAMAEEEENRNLAELEKKHRRDEARAKARFGTLRQSFSSQAGANDIDIEEIEARRTRAIKKIRKEKAAAKQSARVRKAMRYAVDVVDIRMNRMILTVNGTFSETQQALEHELRRQYLANSMATARRDAERHYRVLGKIRRNWEGLGLELCFSKWVKWVKDKSKRNRRDIRRKYKNALREFEAALACIRIAKLNVDLWDEQTDVYSDKPFWVHRVTHEVTWRRPRLEHYVDSNFVPPIPPEPLPEGISLDSSSESDNPYGTDSESEKEKEVENVGDKDEEKEDEESSSSESKGSEGESQQNSSDEGDDEDESKSIAQAARDRRKRQKRLKESQEHVDTAIYAVNKSAIKKRLKAVRKGKITAGDAGLQAFLKKTVDDNGAAATNPTFMLTGDMLRSTGDVKGMSGVQEADMDDAEASQEAENLKMMERPGYMPQPIWNGRWSQNLQTTAYPVATGKSVSSVSALSAGGGSNGFTYGPDSLRVGRPGAGGAVGGISAKTALFPPTRDGDLPSEREQKLIELTRNYVMPTLESIEKLSSQVSAELATTAQSTSDDSKKSTLDKVSETTKREVDDAMVRVKERREHARMIRRETMLRQQNRRETALAERQNEKEVEEFNEAQRLAEINNKEAKFKPMKVAELLVLAGGDPDADHHRRGDRALQHRTVLAKRAVKIKQKHEEDAVEKGIPSAPSRQTFYDRHLAHMFKPDRLSSSDEEDDEDKMQEMEDAVGELGSLRSLKGSTVANRKKSTATNFTQESGRSGSYSKSVSTITTRRSTITPARTVDMSMQQLSSTMKATTSVPAPSPIKVQKQVLLSNKPPNKVNVTQNGINSYR